MYITGITVPANGFVTLIFTEVVDASASAFSTVTFTATVPNPPQPDVTLIAQTLIVRRGLTKELYLGPNSVVPAGVHTPAEFFAAMTMTRFASGSTTPIAVPGGTTAFWLLDHPVAADLNLEDVAGSSIPVQLVLTRPSNGSKSATVNLYRDANCDRVVSGGDLLATSGTTSILSSTSAIETFSLDLAQDELIATGQCLLLGVQNDNGTKSFSVLPYSGTPGETSRLDLKVYNFVKVEIIQTHPTSDNGVWTAPVTEVDGGDIVYFRASISDPFGYYDISAAHFSLSDSTNVQQDPVAGTTAMTIDGDDGAAIRYFVYPNPGGAGYVFPGPAPATPDGQWTITVLADEGQEGAVTDSASGTVTLNPLLPVLLVTKSVTDDTVASDQVITYTIIVENTGEAVAVNVVADDNLGEYLSLAIDPWSNGSPFRFTDSGSGLTGISKWLYSKGAGFVDPGLTPLVDQCNGADAGFDGCVSSVRIILDTTNDMNAGPTGSSFLIEYNMQVQ